MNFELILDALNIGLIEAEHNAPQPYENHICGLDSSLCDQNCANVYAHSLNIDLIKKAINEINIAKTKEETNIF